MAVIVDQKRLGGGSHSTVGTMTDIYTLLRLLFSRIGKPPIGPSNAFSFSDPEGMCRECNGPGRKLGVMWEDYIDKSKSLNEGVIEVPFWAAWATHHVADAGSRELQAPPTGAKPWTPCPPRGTRRVRVRGPRRRRTIRGRFGDESR